MALLPPPSLPTCSPRLPAQLIADWRSAWRFWSVRIATCGAGLMATWSSLPADLREALPYANQVAAALFVAVTIARMLAQRGMASAAPVNVNEYLAPDGAAREGRP
jgi:hypothetical protein